MSVIQQNLGKVDLIAGHVGAARTATGQSSAVDLRDYDGEVLWILDSTAGTGSSPTMDVTIEDSADGSGSWAAISGAAFTQVTGSASQQKLGINKDSCKRYVRIKFTLGGSTPSFHFAVNGLALKKYG